MDKNFRANRVVVEIDDVLLAAIDAEAKARAAGIRRPSRSEVLREMIADHLLANRCSKKTGVKA